MNKKQSKVIELLKEAILKNNTYDQNNPAEIKKCEINDGEFFVSLFITVGRPNDEGTMAEILCRESRQIFIGKRGGVSLAAVDNTATHKSFGYKQVCGFWNVVHTLPYSAKTI